MATTTTAASIPSLEEMLKAGIHFGHTTSRWHPKMAPYLYGKRGGIHLIDLAKTHELLTKAVAFIEDVSATGKPVLFVGVKPLARGVVREAAERCGALFMVNRWIGGTLTNWPAVSGMIKRMKQIEQDEASGRLAKYTKREQLEFKQEHDELERIVGGIRDLSGMPGAIYIVDPKYDKTALSEARKLNIPVVALADSNVNPGRITYPIPGNDDALKSITLVTNVIADAVMAGKSRAAEVAPVKS